MSAARPNPAAASVIDQCQALDLQITFVRSAAGILHLTGPRGEAISVRMAPDNGGMIEQVLQQLDFQFSALPLLTLGESKEIRLLTPRVALARLLPTVYSFTNNRYGVVAGTELIRARFCADLFRAMADDPGSRRLSHAFLGLIETAEGPLLAEHVVDPGNIEVRVKRYHIGSPIHRYRYVSAYSTAHGGPPLDRWSRFDPPIVCFDWRHPLKDDDGKALADEPLPDDYAGVWIDDVKRAKDLARDTFDWIEQRFESCGLKLIDICFFIDRTGRVIFGEISPDCMRVRSDASDAAEALDKDQWRSGGDPAEIVERYQRLQKIVFGERQEWLVAKTGGWDG
jgi:hypothetical protein